ncbi:P-loop containing nucleoside triphosphate hydrolase protein [Cercophora scortea]|uniref:P-loop containing nucleoside triphosphate hydrolase protein n=1 Tax=Cercophora scortea TaxID=314031 RepID=A0AAE0IYY9_9PEZI|nr:P-loop containing nucleoside triphosphate hydrolase protein [Cercophora scortea]
MDVDSDYHPEHSPSPNRALTPEHSDTELPAMSSQATQVKLEATPKAITPGLISRITDDAIEIPSSPPVPASNEILSLDDPHDVLKIKSKGPLHWQNPKDPDRLLVAALFSLPNAQQSDIFDAVRDHPWDEVWKTHIEPIIAGTDSSPARVSFNLARLFDGYISCTAARLTKKKLKSITTARIKREITRFEDYYNLLHQVMPHYPLPTPPRIKLVSRQLSEDAVADDSEQDLGSDSEASQAPDTQTSSTKKRRRVPRRDEEAESLRANDVRRNREFDERRRLLRAQLADGTVAGDNPRLIVNETKESDKQALIYVNENIGRRIKDHQIDGVRFMWNQVVVESKVRQGCLLAHTMGLGKTMQVITLLVVIAEASRSTDPSVYSQIPENLRESKTLILCPPGLVDNWLDEILLWAPKDLLGGLFKLDAAAPAKNRPQIIRQWASEGGVLVAGYPMFSNLYFGDDNSMRQLLEDTPTIVIGDEAHQLKNPDSQRHQSTANFKTMSRIAMTGSPLTKNVMDYYAMINWVAPNYLADKAEFVERFSKPIAEGLWAESNSTQKKTARKMLHVLNATVEPKVHRKDIQVLFNELPTKKEFIITLPLTPVQSRAYGAYVKMIQDPQLGEQLKGQTKIWSLVSTLTNLLAHPQVFKESLLNRNAKTKKENTLEYPKELFEAALATVSFPAVADTSHSNKIKVLIRILDECKIIGDRVLVFSHSIPTLDYLENIMKGQNRKYKRLDGDTPISVRQEATKEFNTDPSMEVYLISTKAGGVGLNIFGANRVVIFDFKYTPADEQQAIGRAYRIGQTKPVYVYWLKVGGTFTDKLHNNAVFKTQLASRVVDKKTPTPLAQKTGDYFTMPTIPEQKDLTKKFGHDTILDALLNTKSDDFKGVIRDVTSTETFEIEENYVLPAEDQREAEQDIEMERLRSQNPQEFKRREQERQSRLGMATYPLSNVTASSSGGEFHAEQRPEIENSATRKRLIKLIDPRRIREGPRLDPAVPTLAAQVGTARAALPSLRSDAEPAVRTLLTANSVSSTHTPALTDNIGSSRQPASTQPAGGDGPATVTPIDIVSGPIKPPSTQPMSAYVTPKFGGFTVPKNGAVPKHSSPTQEPTPNRAEPILAPGTFFRRNESSGTTPQNTSPGPSRRSPDDKHSELVLEALSGRYENLVKADYKPRLPKEVLSEIILALDEQKSHGLPRMDKLQCLQKSIRENERLAKALLAGHIQPKELVSLDRTQIDEKSATYRAMAQGDFERTVLAPDVGTTNSGLHDLDRSSD